MTSSAFEIEGLEVTEPIARALARDGITRPFPVQAAAVPPILAGKDVRIRSGTGTGKTLAYLLPLLQRAQRETVGRILVVAPSPELAIQILRTAERYKDPSLTSASLVGSGNPHRQREKLKKKPRLIVGTPGRVFEMIALRKLPVREIATLVLDEIDRILEPEMEAKLRDVLSRPECDAQIILASATFAPRSGALAREVMKEDRVDISLDESPLRARIHHRVVIVEREKREIRLVRLLEDLKVDRALVFVNKAELVGHLFRFFGDQGVPCVTLSAERSGRARRRALDALREGDVKVLVATDAAARGLDIEDLDWVIHYEIARDAETYLHRAGRTGRAGREGTSLTLAGRKELFLIKRYAKELDIPFEEIGRRA